MKATGRSEERLEWSGTGQAAPWMAQGDPLEALERGAVLQMAERPGMRRRITTFEAVTALDSLPSQSAGSRVWLGVLVVLIPLVLLGAFFFSVGFVSWL